MTHPNEALALTLLVDATAETARSAGHAARHQRADEERQRIQRADEARRRQIREAFSTAMVRLVLLAPVWLFLCFIILAIYPLQKTPKTLTQMLVTPTMYITQKSYPNILIKLHLILFKRISIK